MASVNSPIRSFIKPILFKLLGNRGYKYTQYLAKVKDIKNRLVEEAEMELLPAFINEGDQVLDIGANYAYYSERLSGLVGKKGRVFAFEPISFTHDVCLKVLQHFKCNNVELFKKGVGEKTETVVFNVPVVSFGAISAGQSHIGDRDNTQAKKDASYSFDTHKKETCEVVALDEFLNNKIQKLSFLKIDIEGAEYFALKGMYQLLKQHNPVILIEIVPSFLKGFGVEISDFRTYLETDLGYTLFEYNSTDKKLHKTSKTLVERNYILLPSAQVSNYASLIKS